MWLRRTKFSLALLPLLAGVILSIIAWLHRPDIWFARFAWPTGRFSAGISLQTVDVDWSNWSRAGYAANLESYTGFG